MSTSCSTTRILKTSTKTTKSAKGYKGVVPNPFKPTAGANPPILVGRDDLLEEFQESLDDGPGSPARLCRITGARGVGKTALLAEMAARVRPRGWVLLSETAFTAVTSRLAERAEQTRLRLDAAPPARQVASVQATVGPVGAGLGLTDPTPAPSALRYRLEALLDTVEPHGGGVLVTVDEIQGAANNDLRELAATFQHLVSEDRDVALAIAGLPSAISDVLNDKVLTFLRRATPFELDEVPLELVATALQQTINSGGRSIDQDALDVAARATAGYPFMIQLVGYHLWTKADPDGRISLTDAETAVQQARRRLGSTVHETALADLSEVDRSYLVAMAQDNGPSRTGAVAERMGVSSSYAQVYRSRLREAGMIDVVGHGRVDFTLPYLRDYLRDHASRYPMRAFTNNHTPPPEPKENR